MLFHHTRTTLRRPASSVCARRATFVRAFSASTTSRGHYETLAVPRGASKSQIKSNFYKLSKQYHPDVNPSLEAKSKYQAVTAAYSVLIDDRQRRAYDRDLSPPSSPPHRHPAHPYAQPAHDPGEWAYETRRRSASYAWGARRPSSSSHPHASSSSSSWQQQAHPHRTGPHPAYDRLHPDPTRSPWGSPHVRRATGRRRAPGDEEQEAEDKAQHVSTLGRFAQIGSLLIAMAVLGGGWSANAG